MKTTSEQIYQSLRVVDRNVIETQIHVFHFHRQIARPVIKAVQTNEV